jgi:FkbM family methyltransferase
LRAFAKRLDRERIRRTLGAASCVREPARFVIGELRDIPIVGRYRLRSSGLLAEIRHPLLDMWVLEEIFRFRVYEPPAPVRRALAAIERPVRILDLGGHVGFFGIFMRGLLPDPSIVSFEPDPRNFASLRRCIEANGLQHRWRAIEACAATADGTVEFQSSFHLSRVAASSDDSLREFQTRVGDRFTFLRGTELLSAEPREVACRDVFPFLAQADLVKIDIEGAEWEILADHRLAELEAVAIVLEYHPIGAPPDPEGTLQRELERAGYQVAPSSRGPDAGTVWAWKAGGPTS